MLISLVTLGQGFPVGMAPTHRLQRVALALREAGLGVEILHIGGSQIVNREARGQWRGIPFRYVPPVTRRASNRIARCVVNGTGCLIVLEYLLARRLSSNKELCVFALGLPWTFLRLLGRLRIPVVADISEWYPDLRYEQAIVRTLPFLRGVVAISRGIEQRVNERVVQLGLRRFEVLRVPILLDIASDVPNYEPLDITEPCWLWIGNPQGEIFPHTEFLVRAAAKARTQLPGAKLALVGPFSEEQRTRLESLAANLSGDASWLRMPGFVPKKQLERFLRTATVLLAPLPKGVRWECCFPTKLVEYLAAGRPVITTQVGEVAATLRHLETAWLVAPEDEDGFASAMVTLATDPSLARRIGQSGRVWAVENLDYRIHALSLSGFCKRAAGVRDRTQNTPDSHYGT